jgi:hypothetical protein
MVTVLNAIINCWYASHKERFSFRNISFRRHLKPNLTVGVVVLASMYTTFIITYLEIVSSKEDDGANKTD